MGKVFGFVRYGGVKNQAWLENQLKDIWFGSYKSWVNISRFARPGRSADIRTKFEGEIHADLNGLSNFRRRAEHDSGDVEARRRNVSNQSLRREITQLDKVKMLSANGKRK